MNFQEFDEQVRDTFSHHLLEPLVKIIFNLSHVWGPIYEETR